ncbi:GNAT family N-acetyltransferase [Halalkalicoccus sp. NIPERK01]|uniref:GNAT family N-acetyltransferase n=1 Tax=Halalkalicoccus sp. NIPERK01 TaxID=3053469 RepID=UPI00256EC5FA|nr:GNAT family N-acetyltransferase [Halalkalicoccus sp. NIPERK01]MDL5362106.1 GNAT family N-acetyltransferase [Halalkalicoccus sp. NIPERK01]
MADYDYPEEAAGPFEAPPIEFEDREGRPIEIRVYDEADFEALCKMYDTFDPADRAQGIPPAREERVRSWLDVILEEGQDVVAVDISGSDAPGDQPEADTSGDTDAERVVGHATLVPDGDDAVELAIFVHQDYQGAGIGSRLIRALLGYGAQEGVEKVWLTVERWNHPAVNLYEAVGFEASSVESFELEMTLRLN